MRQADGFSITWKSLSLNYFFCKDRPFCAYSGEVARFVYQRMYCDCTLYTQCVHVHVIFRCNASCMRYFFVQYMGAFTHTV